MFKVKIPSFETYKIATRPVVLTSLKQMLEYFDNDLNQKIYFNGEAEVSKLLGGEYNDKRGGDLGTDVGYDNKIFVEFERENAGYNDELDGNTTDDTIPPVWVDSVTGAKITPKFSTRIYRITVNKYMKDRVTAERYLENIKAKTLGVNQNTLFSMNTHYPMIEPVLRCYLEIFNRLDNAKQIPQDMDFIAWMIYNSKVPAGIIRNIVGNNPAFVFKQCIDDIGVNMDNPTMATVTSGAYIGKFEVSWTYWFYWSEHKNWILEYPMQVFQQPMPPEYMPEVFDETIESNVCKQFFESAAARAIWGDLKINPYYHVLPNFDNWRPAPTNWISPQVQLVVNMEDVDEQVIINIKDIHGFDWNPKLMDYIVKYHSKLTRRHSNPMQFKVYSDNTEVLGEQIELRENGDLILKRKPRMSSIYRVTFNLDYAIRLYNDECIKDLLDDPEWAEFILGVLYPHYPLWPGWGDNGIDDWWKIHNDIDPGDGDEVDFFMPYGMMGLLIIAHNHETYEKYKDLKNRGVIDGTDYYWQGTRETT